MNDCANNLPAFARLPEMESVAAAIDLGGPWKFKAADEDVWLDAIVPGTVHTDLMRAGRLADPYYRDNEMKVQWVERKEWEYRRAFHVGEDFLRLDQIILDCRGLDTIADVYLNGRHLARTCNMFVEHEFDVKAMLRTGENEIRITFRSVLAWNEEQIAAEPRVTWGAAHGVDNEKGTSFFVRKCGADYGWDWGIRLLTCGIWRPIRLAAFAAARMTDLLVRQDLSDPERAMLDIEAQVDTYSDQALSFEIQVTLGGEVVGQAAAPVIGREIRVRLDIEHPQIWWPNGLGDQPLYTVKALLKLGATHVHACKTRIGLRTVELIRENDARGQTFGFSINGRPIFCKGANWIPAGARRDILTEDNYRHLLQSCKDANMNMIRLWGGGQYEAEVFYDYCDENGLLIWHDLMFAVGPYVANEGYLANIRREIAGVARRLRHHPAIVLWCGNNEQESSMPVWCKRFPTVNWADLEKIFYQTVPDLLALHDPDRPYWPSSPHHPLDKEQRSRDAETASGDAHVWDVWHDEQPLSWYAENLDYRFVSEFGLQSLPSMETIRSFTDASDRYFISRILDLHNKGGKKSRGNEDSGNIKLAGYVAAMYRLPENLEGWVYLSQLAQGEAVKTAVEAYRRNFPRTAGTLYWQINDNWPAISWSGIDYYGRWKALHYMARRFFGPVLVCARVRGTRVEIWGVNDTFQTAPARLEWTLARFDGSLLRRGTLDVCLPANGGALLAELEPAGEMGEDPGHVTYRNTNYESKSEHYLAYRLLGETGELSRDVTFFAPPKYAALADPVLKYEVNIRDGRISIDLTAAYFTAYVELGLREGYALFSDNFFHLWPGEAKKVWVVRSETPQDELRRQLYVRNLVDTF